MAPQETLEQVIPGNGSEGGNQQGLETDPNNPTGTSTQDGSGTTTGAAAPSFRHPLLQGKSPEEIEAAFKIMESTVREQGRALNERIDATKPPADPVVEVTDEEYWKNPTNALKGLIAQAVAPLKKELEEARKNNTAPTIRAELSSQYEDFKILEPAINEVLRNKGIKSDEATKEQLEEAYYTTYGYASRNGYLPNKETTVTPTPPNPNPNPAPALGIPQHRPSSAPLPAAASATKTRELTENEARLAREYNMTREEFIAWQNEDIENVVTSTIGQGGNK